MLYRRKPLKVSSLASSSVFRVGGIFLKINCLIWVEFYYILKIIPGVMYLAIGTQVHIDLFLELRPFFL